jgi:hypothetical protein
MKSPYRMHPTLPLPEMGNTIPFPAAAPKLQATPLAQPPQSAQGPSKLERLVALEGEIRQQPKRRA